MKIQKGLIFLLLCSSLYSSEFRFGKSSFNWDMSVANFMGCSVDMDVNVYSVNEHHKSLGSSKFYYFYNADFYQSNFMDTMTQLASTPVTMNLPFIGGSISDMIDKYTMIPVPSEYKVEGFDLNLGVGYDVYKENNNYIGIGLNGGVSMPSMKMKNLVETAQFTYVLLDKTETEIMTYKIGPSIQANFEITPKVSLYGYASYGFQTGTMENNWFRSSMDADGTYSVFDFGLKYTPWSTTKDLGWITLNPKLYFTAGYTSKNWEVDEVSVDMFNIFNANAGGMFDTSFDTQYAYVGAGYEF